MLSTLRRIVQEVSTARELQAALDIIVSSVGKAMRSDVCSVFLYDEDTKCYTLMATEGLNQKAVRRVSLKYSEGLVGLVGQRKEPINLEDAASHPDFCYLEDTGEERYGSFLGVPVIYHRELLGVLVIQQSERRSFDESDESFLVTISAQLAGLIAHARATGSLAANASAFSYDQPANDSPPSTGSQHSHFHGVAGSPGIAIGKAIVLAPPADISSVLEKDSGDIDKELQLFRQALADVREHLQEMAERFSGHIPLEEQALFDVYLHILDDSAIGPEIEAIIQQGQWAQGALKQVVQKHVRRFELMENPYLRERAVDVRDLGRRVLAALQKRQKNDVVWDENTIVISEELTPAMLGDIPREKLMGLVSVQGSSNSHAAILARAMGVPTVMGAVDLPWDLISGHDLIIDGNLGRIYASPPPELRREYQKLIDEEQTLIAELDELQGKPCITPDQHRVPLWVNTGLMADTVRSLRNGAEGVGLYRTEVPFMIRERFPSESEQKAVYRELMAAFAPRPVTIRTLDIGGDKSLDYFPIKEQNPFLGWRGIRVTLDHPEIFVVQVRAMLKASEGLNNLRIMLPMVSRVSEIDDALDLIDRAYNELRGEGIEISRPLIGVMVEVPAAVYLVREFARRVDFLSIGSNDLTQYLLAVDRNNPRVANLYQPCHPAVLQALVKVVNDAHAENTSVSICGEMAGDPCLAVLLMAMGFDVLSMSAANLPRVKWTLCNMPLSDAQELLRSVLTMDRAKTIRATVEQALRERGLDRVALITSEQ